MSSATVVPAEDRDQSIILVNEFARHCLLRPNVEPEYGLLRDLVNSFAAQPAMVRRAIRELLVRQPERVCAAALDLVKNDGTGEGYDYLISLILDNNLLLLALANPNAFPPKTVAELAAGLSRIDQQLDVKLLHLALDLTAEVPQCARVPHVLDIIDEISDCSHLAPFLMKLAKHPNKRIRSKAILLLVRAHRNVDWLQQQMSDDDPRFRANAIEGLLFTQPSEKEIKLLWLPPPTVTTVSPLPPCAYSSFSVKPRPAIS